MCFMCCVVSYIYIYIYIYKRVAGAQGQGGGSEVLAAGVVEEVDDLGGARKRSGGLH